LRRDIVPETMASSSCASGNPERMFLPNTEAWLIAAEDQLPGLGIQDKYLPACRGRLRWEHCGWSPIMEAKNLDATVNMVGAP